MYRRKLKTVAPFSKYCGFELPVTREIWWLFCLQDMEKTSAKKMQESKIIFRFLFMYDSIFIGMPNNQKNAGLPKYWIRIKQADRMG